jgi:hypothetical protein
VPDRNVLLTGRGWGGARTASSHHDPAGQRPTGGTEESAEEADHAKPGARRMNGGVRAARSERVSRGLNLRDIVAGGREARDEFIGGEKLVKLRIAGDVRVTAGIFRHRPSRAARARR